jgi:DNA-binding beta-propeller fold protein YncE
MKRMALLILLAIATGCGGETTADGNRLVIGGPGPLDGRFISPRGVSVAAERVWVVDRSGRVQAFALDGRHLLTVELPRPEGRGFPIGVLALDDGGCFVADTHASRVLRYDANGHEVLRFGSLGTAAGSFVYPQRVLLHEGELYITEYGDGAANRVQVFKPDGTREPRWRLRRHFGSFGSGPGQFTRCMGLARLGDELFICDASDQVLVFDLHGKFLRAFGSHGDGAGEFRYPYGCCALDGALYVAEYGGHRIQKLSPQGECLGCFGVPGSGSGQLNGPWDVCASGGKLYVADTGNHRVVVVDPAGPGWYLPGQ